MSTRVAWGNVWVNWELLTDCTLSGGQCRFPRASAVWPGYSMRRLATWGLGPEATWLATAGGGGIVGWVLDVVFSLAGKPELPRQPGSTAQYDADAGSLDAEPTESDSPQSSSTDSSRFLHTLDWHGGCRPPPGTLCP